MDCRTTDNDNDNVHITSRISVLGTTGSGQL
jgi:hypothetical protein